mmetsp:Transcript_16811/g.26175  ORF Transcript_16811/g.26175 Transcript_16811/m.26175 type:complete len:98 (+) Transcript_16811:130-423(+)
MLLLEAGNILRFGLDDPPPPFDPSLLPMVTEGNAAASTCKLVCKGTGRGEVVVAEGFGRFPVELISTDAFLPPSSLKNCARCSGGFCWVPILACPPP